MKPLRFSKIPKEVFAVRHTIRELDTEKVIKEIDELRSLLKEVQKQLKKEKKEREEGMFIYSVRVLYSPNSKDEMEE